MDDVARAEEQVPIRRMLTPADLLSLGNAFLGLLAILAAFNHEVRLAFTLIVVAAIFDGLDGVVTRWGHGGGRLGGTLDSMADLVSFVVAPTLLVWNVYGDPVRLQGALGVPAGISGAALVLGAAAFYFTLGLLRLARFDYLKGGDRDDYFVGVTSPGGAIVVASIGLLNWEPAPALVVVALTALLMASRLRLPKVRGALMPASGLVLLAAAVVGDALNGLGPMLLLASFAMYLILGPIAVRRHDAAEEEAHPSW